MSRPNYFQLVRMKNIQTLKQIIEKEAPVKHSKLIALIGIYGVTEKTANTYLKTLQDGEFIEYNVEKKEWSIIEEVSKED